MFNLHLPQYNDTHSSLICCVCLQVLNRPVLLPCNELLCGPCCSQWVAVSWLMHGESRGLGTTIGSYADIKWYNTVM